MSISVTNVIRNYGAQKALNGVSFEINSGEVVGFLGPNGAGKSTMMKIITGFLPQTSGEVRVCGLNVDEKSSAYKRKIGYLPEHNPLYLDMYVKEYLNYVAGVYKLGKSTKVKVDEMIDKTGLRQECTKKIGALSKGYRQRVGLAQALLPDPEVLILDEPTTGLDPNQIVEVRELIKQVGKEKTIMLSTHIMQEVQAICERVIIINKGNVVADESADSLTHIQTGNQHVITVELLEKTVEEELNVIQGISDRKKIGDNKFQVIAEKDIRSDIFDWAVAKNKKLLTLQQDFKSMEDVFRDLTK